MDSGLTVVRGNNCGPPALDGAAVVVVLSLKVLIGVQTTSGSQARGLWDAHYDNISLVLELHPKRNFTVFMSGVLSVGL